MHRQRQVNAPELQGHMCALKGRLTSNQGGEFGTGAFTEVVLQHGMHVFLAFSVDYP